MPFGYDPERRQVMRDWSREMNDEKDALRQQRAVAEAQMPAPRPPSDAKLRKEAAVQEEVRKASLRQSTTEPERLTYALTPTKGRRYLRCEMPEESAADGARIIDLGLLTKHVVSKLPCDSCHKRGVLMLAARHEVQRGLASDLGIWCSSCRAVTGELPTSHALPGGSPRDRAKPMQIKARAALGAANAGMGHSSINRFVACLGLPTIPLRCYSTVDKLVRKACITVGDASEQRALLEEQRLSFEAGAVVDDRGRVPIAISYDGRWQKPGAAKNSMEGFGAAIGGRSQKVVASTWRSKDCARCKLGLPCGGACNRTFGGPSGNMEPLMGAELVDMLNADGVIVTELVTDLDAKVDAAVRAACTAAGDAPPEWKYDPNHVGKAFDGKLIPTAKRLVGSRRRGRRAVLTKPVAERLSMEMRAALRQHRLSGEQTLKGALSNVINHAFNRHDACCRYFQCPVALGQRTTSSYNTAGDWLDVLGGAPLELALRSEFEKRMTSNAKLRRLAHAYSTQVNEALHSSQVSMYPKRLHLGGGIGGRARQKLSNSRINDGCEASTVAVLRTLGVEEPAGSQMRRGLAWFDARAAYDHKRRQQPKAKAQRRQARKRRKVRDAKGGGAQAGPAGYGANIAWGSDDDDDGEGEGDGDDDDDE